VTKYDVAVVGGGPAGLAAAIALHRKGLRPVVIEQARPPLDKTCGEGLMPDGLLALRTLGIFPETARSFPFRGIRFWRGAASVEADFPGGCGLGVRRTVLHDLLCRHAVEAGIEICWGTKVIGLDSGRLETSEGAILCEWVVGADGQNSGVRRWARLAGVFYELRRFGQRQHFAVEPWTDRVEVYWGDRYQIVITPVAPDCVCAALVSDDSHMRVRDAFREIPELGARLGGATPVTPERGAATAVRVLRRVADGRVLLIGDASGSVDPITGEGLCVAFKQGIALADAVASGNLARYRRAQRRCAVKPVLMSSIMVSLGRNAKFRDLSIHALASHPAVFRFLLAFHTGGKPAVSSRALKASAATEGSLIR
jgi:menaquinone-9 beta-reductase